MGLASARELRRRGYSVTLLERGQPGRAASWASAGIIGATLRDETDPNLELRRVSRQMWPAFAEAIQAESGMDPEYREMGCIYLATNEQEAEALQPRANSETEAQWLDPKALRELETAVAQDVPGGLLVPGGNVDNRRLCRALEIAARRAGVSIKTGTEVRAITTQSGRVTGVRTATSDHSAGGRVSGLQTAGGDDYSANLVIVAAGAWSSSIDHVSPALPVRPQRGQILALDQTSVGIQRVLLTAGDPYFVPRADGRLLVGATREEAGWDPSITAGGIAWLLNRAMQVVPRLSGCPIAEIWTGFRPLSADGLPMIGRGDLDGLFILTGHGPSGIAPLPGSIALLMALVAGEPPPVAPEPFDPLRFNRKSP